MELIENVTVEKKINVYFEGKVTSRNIYLKNKTKKTLGVMMPGTYEFETEKKETMDTQMNMNKFRQSRISSKKKIKAWN